ncbi:hypothetical protein LCGC14_0669790 [marine sediment metagenome]|uniref:Methyltransferase FkbM domain-containing protein n=1 Tax=marine sediment metagenome TaxID=412755 RepID=A0A0F9QRA2_9ZZZZ
MSYSQQGEDEYILSILKDFKGRFLDIGAHDGKSNSNTRALFERGWLGVCIEPCSRSFTVLEQLYRKTDVQCLNVLIGASCELARWWIADDGSLNTADERHRATWMRQARIKYRQSWVGSIDIPELLKHHPGPYHVISIDTEGTSDEIAISIPFKKLETRIAIVEYGYESLRLMEHMSREDFTLEQTTGSNQIWLKS